MLSIIIFYSPDRLEQLKKTVACLEDMEFYKQCQKILCVDGACNVSLDSFKIVNVPRPKSGNFQWSASWLAGIENAIYEKILYLDSDRVLPKNYLRLVLDNLSEKKVLYSKSLYYVEDVNLEIIKKTRDEIQQNLDIPFIEKDFRHPYPPDLEYVNPGKSCMSGNTAFTKSMYFDSGGVDPFFEGYGAVDTDFYINAYKKGYEILTLPANELHIRHQPSFDLEDMKLISLFNHVYLAKKWSMKLGDIYSKRLVNHNISFDYVSSFRNFNDFLSDFKKGGLN